MIKRIKDYLLRCLVNFEMGPPPPRFLVEIKPLAPGQAWRVTVPRTKISYVIMEADDFDHIAALGGMVAKEIEVTTVLRAQVNELEAEVTKWKEAYDDAHAAMTRSSGGADAVK